MANSIATKSLGNPFLFWLGVWVAILGFLTMVAGILISIFSIGNPLEFWLGISTAILGFLAGVAGTLVIIF